MTKYRIRLANGRVIGPFEKSQLFELKSNGRIKGTEEAQIFPTGNWGPLRQFDFYAELMDENKTVLQSKTSEETFLIDLTKIRNIKNEKALEELGEEKHAPAEPMTETIRIAQVQKTELEKKKEEVVEVDVLSKLLVQEPMSSINLRSSKVDNYDKTLINPVAQEELAALKRKQKAVEDKKAADEALKAQPPIVVKSNEVIVAEDDNVVNYDEATQMFKLEKTELLLTAEEAELTIEKDIKKVQRERAIEEGTGDEDKFEDPDIKKAKRKKIIIVVAALCLIYVLLFPEEKPKQRPFQHIDPKIIFPIPFDQADNNKARAEYERGIKFFETGSYPGLIKAGLSFKNAYENNLSDINSLSFMVRSYAEELEHSSEKLADAQTVFNIIQSKRSELLQDPNGVIGLNLFYMAIDKKDAANDVMQKYLKLQPKNLTQDLFATYVHSLLQNGKIDVATKFITALKKAPKKNRYVYKSLAEYYLLNQEKELAMEMLSDAIKDHPKNVYFLLAKADLMIKEGNFDGAIPYIKKAEALNLDYNNSNRAKLFELKGMTYASKKRPKEATIYFAKSLKLKDSDELRIKLADLQSTAGTMKETDNLINESTAIKYLIEARKFFEQRNYNLALSAAAKATDAFPNHIPSEIFLSKIQLRLGLAREGLKTLETLIGKYPDDKLVNVALIKAYIDTYKFNDARTRIQMMAGTDARDSWEFASVKAHLFSKMADTLQAMSWLKTSISLNPLNDEDVFSLATILLKRGNFDAGKLLLNKCMELDPVNPDYRIAYARMIYETQDDQAAIGYLLSLQEEFGENAKVMSEIAIFYYRAGKVKDFQDYKAKLEKLHSSDKALYEFLVKAALLDERYSEIPGLVEKLLAIEPGELEHMMTAGKVLFESKKYIDAARWFKRVQDKLPSYPKVLYFIAKIDYLSGDLDAALKKIQEDIQANGENDDDLVFMAQIYQDKDDFIQAENLYKKAQKINPRSYDAIMGLADLSSKRNNFDLALDLYKRGNKLNPEEPIVHKKIGDVYRQLGQGSLAIESYKLYLEMDPDSPHKKNLESYMELMK